MSLFWELGLSTPAVVHRVSWFLCLPLDLSKKGFNWSRMDRSRSSHFVSYSVPTYFCGYGTVTTASPQGGNHCILKDFGGLGVQLSGRASAWPEYGLGFHRQHIQCLFLLVTVIPRIWSSPLLPFLVSENATAMSSQTFLRIYPVVVTCKPGTLSVATTEPYPHLFPKCSLAPPPWSLLSLY